MATPRYDTAPWKDWAGCKIRHGDRMRHADGTTFVAIRLEGFDHPADAWRAVYSDLTVSRLCLQIGKRGQACVYDR